MKIGDRTVVVTPIDNPCQYDPDWRSAIASALVEDPTARIDPEYQRYRADPFIRKQIMYLKSYRSGKCVSKDAIPVRFANLWAQGTSVSDAKFRIEPLLLTAVDYETISLDITGEGENKTAIEAYEKLFFNIRDNEGRLSRSCQLKQYFAMPSGELDTETPPEAMWKMIGALMGYDTLVNMWLWRDAHGIVNKSQDYILDEMWRVAQSRLFLSMFANRIGHESMAKLLASISAQQKMLHEDKDSGALSDELTLTLMNVLKLVSPKVLGQAATEVDIQQRVMEAVNARLEAEKAVSVIDIGTTGKNGVHFLPNKEIEDADEPAGSVEEHEV